jgi:hypothetical protein
MFELMSGGVAWVMCHSLALLLCFIVVLFLFFASVFIWCVVREYPVADGVLRTPLKIWVRIVAQVAVVAIACVGFRLSWMAGTHGNETCQQNFYGEANVEKGEIKCQSYLL